MYVSGLLFGKALQVGTKGKSGPVTTSEIYNGLYSIHHDTLGGMAPPLTFTARKPSPVDCWYWIGIHTRSSRRPTALRPSASHRRPVRCDPCARAPSRGAGVPRRPEPA
jgi:hypothetical protein